MKIFLHSLGCDKNLVDSELMLGQLFAAGFTMATEPSTASVIIVNTCGFIQAAVEEAIETIFEMAQYKQIGDCQTLIVTGCMAQRHRDEILKEFPEVDAVLGVNNFSAIASIVLEPSQAEPSDTDIFDEELYEKRAITAPMHVAYIKIAEGCDNHCTYCTIPSIRGKYRSRKFESILAECQRLTKAGARELVLIAQDTARYGVDLYGKPRLHDLLAAIAALEELTWVRLMYSYPEHIYPELIDTIVEHEKICNYLDMPIQHSHNAVLKRMGRRETHEFLRELVTNLHAKGIVVRTTLIVGFPGETEEEFNHLKQFVQEMQFEHLGVFTYSQEEGTPAAKMEPQIPDIVKQQRQETLLNLQASLAEDRQKNFIGQTMTVMVDEFSSDEVDNILVINGRSTRDAFDVDGLVSFPSAVEFVSGETVRVKITESLGAYHLYGELVE